MAELFRDAHGVPHVRAADILSLADAQGEVTARDRAWQIEVARLRSEGRLAELIGAAGVAFDVFARRARIDDTARRAHAALDAETAAFVAAYVGGVRRGLRGRVTAEHRALEARFGDAVDAGEWPGHAPLGILHVAHVLFTSYPVILWRAHVARTLGSDWIDLLEPADHAPTSGSNAWALHGSRTDSGMPLLAGDPHRTFELPGVYQQVRLACDEFDVVGLAFPGVPGIPHFAHACDVAWGITNAMAHGADVFRETLRRTPDGVEALGPDGWRPADVQRSTIHVRGGLDVEVEAIETQRGPVVTDLVDTPEGLVGWSVRLPARVDADLGVATLLPLLRARTARDVVDAFGTWVDPVNRLLTADRAGAVLSATVGRVVDRPAKGRLLPHDARATTVAPCRRMPQAVAVADAHVDANERPTRPEIDLGGRYAAPHRAERIAALLAERRPGSVEGFVPVWADTVASSAVALVGLLPRGPIDGVAGALRDALVAWDGSMDADSDAAGAFGRWRDALTRRVAAHPALAAVREPHGFGAVYDTWFAVEPHVASGLTRILAHPALARDAESLAADALAEVAAAGPARWGELHRLLPAHALGGVDGVDAPVARLDVALSGDIDTVRCTGSLAGVDPRAWRGSVARWAWDLADRAQSRWSVPFGASGDPASPHFADQLDAWRRAAPTRIVLEWSALEPDRPLGPLGAS